jgi:hypothetical protein
MTTEFRRLGKRGAYRFGQLQTQGIPGQRGPVPFQPRFGRQYPRRSARARLLVLVAGFLLIAGGAAAGWWFMRLAVASLAGRPVRSAAMQPGQRGYVSGLGKKASAAA